MKKRRKRLYTAAAAAMVLLAVFLAAGCKAAGKDAETAGKTAETAADAVAEAEIETEKETEAGKAAETATESAGVSEGIAATDLYGDVLAQYSDMVQNDFYWEFIENEDWEAFNSSFGEDIGIEIRHSRADVYYACYDIDGNGTEELIIAAGNGDGAGSEVSLWNYDLYAHDGTKAVHVFPEMDFGYRTNFFLYENGIIEVSYSSSAAESGTDIYKMSADGIGHDRIDSFAIKGHLEGDQPVIAYSQNGAEITEEEFYAKLQGYEVPLTAELEWVQVQ